MRSDARDATVKPMLRFRTFCAVFLALALAACKPSEQTQVTAIVGPVLIDGNGGAPVSDAVVLVVGGRIRAAGPRASVPVPASANYIDGRGRFLVPKLIDLDRQPGLKLSQVVTQTEVKRLLDLGASAFFGIMVDSEDIDPALLRRLRDLRVVFAPRLWRFEGTALARAMRNTKRLAVAGVPIAVASGGDTMREIELLSQAGLSPMEVLGAATRNGALALKKSAELGAIAPGLRADLLLLGANPLEDVRNLGKVEKVMEGGQP